MTPSTLPNLWEGKPLWIIPCIVAGPPKHIPYQVNVTGQMGTTSYKSPSSFCLTGKKKPLDSKETIKCTINTELLLPNKTSCILEQQVQSEQKSQREGMKIQGGCDPEASVSPCKHCSSTQAVLAPAPCYNKVTVLLCPDPPKTISFHSLTALPFSKSYSGCSSTKSWLNLSLNPQTIFLPHVIHRSHGRNDLCFAALLPFKVEASIFHLSAFTGSKQFTLRGTALSEYFIAWR